MLRIAPRTDVERNVMGKMDVAPEVFGGQSLST